jgi:hypothetical protein
MLAFAQMSKREMTQLLPRVINEFAMYARTNASDDFVRDSASSCSPIFNAWLAAFWITEQHDFIAELNIQVSNVQYELIHTNSARNLTDFATHQNRTTVGCAAWNSVSVSGWNQCQGCVSCGVVLMCV